MPIRIPKLFVKGIRVPAGPMEGSLALPCPCGEPVVFDGMRDLYLGKNNQGILTFYHEGCQMMPGG